MENFMKYDFDISEVILACRVIKPTLIHTNRPSHGLALNASGTVRYTFDNGISILSGKHDVVFLPKHSNYRSEVIEPTDCYAINFNLHTEISFEPFKIPLKNIAHFQKQYILAQQIWQKRDVGFQMKSKSILYDIISSIQKEYSIKYISSKNAELIVPAISYIHDNYDKEVINIITLSNMCNISDTYFRKIFRQIYGISPLKYINNLKFERAKELIISGDYSIHEVAVMSGFNDDSHFSREFKKNFGYSPNKFTKEYL